MKGSVLFLDLARQTGWCDGVPGERPVSGTTRLAPPDSGSAAVMGGMIQWLGERLKAFRPRAIVYEAPFHGQNMHTTMIAWGLAGVTEGVGDRMGVYRIEKANLSTIRSRVMGNGRAKKWEIIEHVKGLGFDPLDDNEADAILGWLYACSVVDPAAAAAATKLFANNEK